MADPITLAIVMGAMMAAQQAQQYKQQRQQAKFARYQADVQAHNARIATAQGVEEEHRLRREQRRQIGAQRAGLAESGIFGISAMDALEESMINAEMDVLNTRANTLQTRENYLQQSNVKIYESKMYNKQARNTLLMAPFKIATASAGGFGGAGGGAGGGNGLSQGSLQFGKMGASGGAF